MSADFEKELYTRLWENINHKDTRIWTFLSFYGATIALVLGQAGPTHLAFALPFISLMSFWAVQFVLASEWWSARNRLMIGSIEAHNPDLHRNIPPAYQGPRFTTDDITITSLLILLSLQTIFMMATIYYLDGAHSCEIKPRFSSFQTTICDRLVQNQPLVPIIAKIVCILITITTFDRREKNIDKYWNVYFSMRAKHLADHKALCAHVLFNQPVETSLRRWREDRHRFFHRPAMFIVISALVFSDRVFDVDSIEGSSDFVPFFFFCCAFLYQAIMYYRFRPNEDVVFPTGMLSFNHVGNIVFLIAILWCAIAIR